MVRYFISAVLIVPSLGCAPEDTPAPVRAQRKSGVAPVKNEIAKPIRKVPVSATQQNVDAIRNNLRTFQDPQQWRGNRWRVVGIRDGFPVTQSIGAWNVDVVATDKQAVCELRGIKIGDPKLVQLDWERGVLIIDGEVFLGRPIEGKSPIVRDAPFKGAVFEREDGNVIGNASILMLEDGRLLLDFHKVWAGWHRGEYGMLSPSK